MTTIRPYRSLPCLTVPSATPREIVSSLLQFAECFGITRDANFNRRCYGLVFTNAVMLGVIQPDGAARLRDLLQPFAPSDETIRAAASCVAETVEDDNSWLDSIRGSLELSIGPVDNPDRAADLTPRVIAALCIGLEVVGNQFPLTALIERRVTKLNDENLFLCALLVNWCRQGFRPLAEPFVEYVHAYYSKMPVEQSVMCAEASEVLVGAHQRPNPWALSFWVEQAWTRGRRLVESRPDVARQLVAESSEANRRYTLALFRELILCPAGTHGPVDLERATLAYFARTESGAWAVEHCAGDQPRKLARLAFDFAFWMGIISAIPIPGTPTSAVSQELAS